MSHKTDDLDHVYGAKSPDETRRVYDGWASEYDADNLRNGFWLPTLGAGCLARYLGPTSDPVLDAGCGTGLVGQSLAVMGYGSITGCDLSPEMIEIARGSGAYAGFDVADMGASLPYADNHFAGFSCFGSFGPGHAPPSTLEHLTRVTRPGGYGAFNLIEATYVDQGFSNVMDRLSDSGAWEIVHLSAPFLPFLLAEPDLWTRAYVVRIKE